MKFLTRLNRNMIKVLTLTLLFLAVTGYFALKAMILNETKENLQNRERLIRRQIAETGKGPDFFPFAEVVELNERSDPSPAYSISYIWDKTENESEPYLEFTDIIEVNGRFYRIILRHSTVENSDLILVVGITLLTLLIIVLGLSYTANLIMNRSLWRDFEDNLKRIEEFDLNSRGGMDLQPADIQEFDRLNRVLNTLSSRLARDYRLLKEFTENASHEIQTPISIALMQLDEMIQIDMDPAVLEKIQTVRESLRRLSALNRQMLLLAKIENRQFEASAGTDLGEIVKTMVNEFAPLIKAGQISINSEQDAPFILHMHETLARTLVGNLLSNAVRYNTDGGFIRIHTGSASLTVCNSGEKPDFDTGMIFERFSRGRTGSHGLGLAIVKKICDTHDLDIEYSYAGKHCIRITVK